MATVAMLLGSGSYFADNIQSSVSEHILFVEAQEDLLIAETPVGQESIDGSGKISTADFYAWYGLEDMEFLDKEYSSVRSMLGNEMTNLEEAESETCLLGEKKSASKYEFNKQTFKCVWR